jgi:Endonuclease-reverse transcriptase
VGGRARSRADMRSGEGGRSDKIESGSMEGGKGGTRLGERTEFISFMCTNIRSINNKEKKEELKMRMDDNNIDVLGITESWATGEIEDGELYFKGYMMLRNDRVVGDRKRGGGVLLYIKDDLVAYKVEERKSEGTESIWARIKVGKDREILVGVCYRRPGCEVVEEDKLIECVEHFSGKNAIIMGDFNYPGINWELLRSGREGKKFLKVVNDAFLVQMVGKATRGRNILDLVLCGEPERILEIEVECPVSNSDHAVLTWKVACEVDREERKMVRYKYFKGNYQAINKELLSVEWEKEWKGVKVKDRWDRVCQENSRTN